MPIFTPRLNYAGTDTLDYYTTANPFYTATEWGYNPASGQMEWLSLWMPNCTAYAFGRFNELANEHSLNYRWPTGPGDSWYNAAPGKGLLRGQTPSIGAAMCWSYPAEPNSGHVSVIEQLIYDSNNQLIQIVTSNSAWYGYNPPRYPQNAYPWFYLEYIDPNNLDHHANQHFEGFIYHPDFPPGSVPMSTSSLISILTAGKGSKVVKIISNRRRNIS